MTCQHLKDLYHVCQEHGLKLTSMDLIRIVCTQCGVEEQCPSVLCDEYDQRHHEPPIAGSEPPENGVPLGKIP